MIQVSHLTKMYGPRTAVSDLSFNVEKGEIVGFLGPNGAGKSTTMKIITGLMPATAGKVTVAGYDVFDKSIEAKRNIGFLPETPPVYPDMQVEDYLDFAARLHQVPNSSLRSAVDTALQKTALTDVRRRLIGNLSKGYRQRVGLAQAIIHNPKVLILDEPTVGLDPNQILEIRDLITGFAGDHTVILSSHILQEVTATCKRVIVIAKGRIAAQDSIERLTTRMRSGLVCNLVVRNAAAQGIEAIRRIPGVMGASTRGADTVEIEIAQGSESARERIVETAVHAGMGVLEFAAERKSLEEVFRDLTTSQGA